MAASVGSSVAICAAAVVAMAWGMGTTLAQAQNFEGVDSGFPAPIGESSVLPNNVKLMRLWDGGCVLTEGVAAGQSPSNHSPFFDANEDALLTGVRTLVGFAFDYNAGEGE